MTKAIFILGLVFSLSQIPLQAQTRRIAYKSHSGSTGNYKKLCLNKPFSVGTSNFGENSHTFKYHLDSIIYINPKMSVMVTRRYDFTPSGTGPKWISYRDTIYGSALLSHRHSLDSIKAVYTRNGVFSNSMEKVVFLGYDNLPVSGKK